VGGGTVRPTNSNPNDNFFAFENLPQGDYVAKVKVNEGKELLLYNIVFNLDEAGGSLANARNLGNLGGKRETVNDHVGIPYKEEDYYKFSTDSSARPLFFAVRHESGSKTAKLNGDVKFILFDKNGRTVTEVDSVDREPILSSVSSSDLKPNSEYYVKVRARNQDSTNYHLVLNLEGKNNSGGDNWQHPLPGYTISSPYGWRTHPITGKRSHHGGTDFGTGNSNPTIVSAKAGKVVLAREGLNDTCEGGTNFGYGNLVIIDHGGGILTRYAHLDSISVTEGSQVLSGTPIGTVGTTGCSTGNHLHFEVRINGNSQNPWSGEHTDPMQYI
jgi:murein DD-endopeptidase MepM/ murein hydrolase activator NlpD